MNEVPPGSYLALTHPTYELGGEANHAVMRYWNARARPLIRAGGGEIRRLIEDLALLDPLLVSCALWRDDDRDAESVPQYAAVARKP
jgi:hypothetical protein